MVVVIVVGFVVFVDYLLFCGSGDCVICGLLCWLWLGLAVVLGVGILWLVYGLVPSIVCWFVTEWIGWLL